MITRQSTFIIPVLRQAPAGIERVTAAAARGGFLRLPAQGGLEWLPLGARLVDRIRDLLRGEVLRDSPVDADRPLSPLLDRLRPGATARDGRPRVAFAEWGRRSETARNLKDTSDLGVMEWAVLAPNAERGRGELTETERRVLQVLQQCGVTVRMAEGGRGRTLWSRQEAVGGSQFLHCGTCGYLAEASTARFALAASEPAAPEPLRPVATPGAKTIGLLCEQLHITPASTLKALFLTTAKGETLMAAIRGDLEVSLEKLSLEIGTASLRPATPEEIAGLGVVAGYAGPVGLVVRHDRRAHGVWLVADRSIAESANLVAGANQEGVHLTGVNYGRDFRVTEVLDLASAPRSAICAVCGGPLVAEKGLIVAQACVSVVEDLADAEPGEVKPPVLFSLQVFPGAVTVAVLAAALRDSGFRFPAACAPFAVHFLPLPGGLDSTAILEALDRQGLDVLIDDRDVSAGVKFAESEWIGSPVLIVAGRRSSEAGGVEVRCPSGSKSIVEPAEVASSVEACLANVM